MLSDKSNPPPCKRHGKPFCIECHTQPSELEMHRADYKAIKDAGFESPGELLSAYQTLEKRLAELEQERVCEHCGLPAEHLTVFQCIDDLWEYVREERAKALEDAALDLLRVAGIHTLDMRLAYNHAAEHIRIRAQAIREVWE